MKNWKKVTIALAAVGGTLMVATPAFADVNLSAAGSGQWQNGSDASGTVMDQNSNVQVGQLQADGYYNSTTSKGYTDSQNTYTVDESKHDTTLANSQTTLSYGGSSWTKADDFTSQGASVSQNQSQIIGANLGDEANWGGTQCQVSGAVSGTLNDNLSGGGALSFQHQSGAGASQVTMNQTSSVQAGYTQADSYQYDTVSKGGVNTSNTYSSGALVSSTSNTGYGGSSYTKATEFSNPTAGATQDQNQAIGHDGSGGTQGQVSGAVAGSLNGLWGDVASPALGGK